MRVFVDAMMNAQAEIRAMGGTVHRHVLRIRGCWWGEREGRGELWIVTDYCNGGTLAQLLANSDAVLPLANRVVLGEQVSVWCVYGIAIVCLCLVFMS